MSEKAADLAVNQVMNTERMRQEQSKPEPQEEAKSNKLSVGVIGVGAAGGNLAAVMTSHGYPTIAFNTTASDMVGLNVDEKIILKDMDGSGKDRAFSEKKFKESYKTFFSYPKVKELLKNDLIFVGASGGGGSGTIIGIMIAAFLKSEYPDKLIIFVGLLGSIREDRQSQINMREFLSDLENKSGCPYMLYDNNRVKDKQGQEVYRTVNEEAALAMRVVAKEFHDYNHDRSKMDSRDYSRLLSFKGLMSVLTIDDLRLSVSNEKISLTDHLTRALENTTAVVTGNVDAYGFHMDVPSELYDSIDIDFDQEQRLFGNYPSSGLVVKQLQSSDSNGPQMAVYLTGSEAPVGRFTMIDKRINEYQSASKEKTTLPPVERNKESMDLAGDGRGSQTGKGDSALDAF